MTHTIALVDDDQNILVSVSMALEAEGFKVNTYTDGATALEGMGRQPVDLAILDIKMPRMDGMELLSHIRENSALPVIFLTSKDEEIDEIAGLQIGADDYIKKPFSQRLLIERITHLLPIRERMDQAARLEVEAGPTGALDGLPADPSAERERLLYEVATLGNRLQQTQADAEEPHSNPTLGPRSRTGSSAAWVPVTKRGIRVRRLP